MTNFQGKDLLPTCLSSMLFELLDGHPELEMRNCDKVVFLVQGRIEHQVYSGRYPDIVTERHEW